MSFHVEQAKHDDAARLARLASAHFVHYEPMAKVRGVEQRELLPLVEVMVAASLADGLAIMATERETGLDAGFLVARSLARPLALDFEPSAKVQSIFALIDALEVDYLGKTALDHTQIACALMIGVRRDIGLRARSLALTMMQALREPLLKAGAKEIYVTTTSSASHQFFKSFGAECISETAYKSYQCPVTGGTPFARLPGACKLARVRL